MQCNAAGLSAWAGCKQHQINKQCVHNAAVTEEVISAGKLYR
jgi:hypothetical protein